MQLSMIACRVDGFHDRRQCQAVIMGDLHAPAQKIDRDIFGTSLAHSALNSGLAGAAAHAADVKICYAFFTHRIHFFLGY